MEMMKFIIAYRTKMRYDVNRAHKSVLHDSPVCESSPLLSPRLDSVYRAGVFLPGCRCSTKKMIVKLSQESEKHSVKLHKGKLGFS